MSKIPKTPRLTRAQIAEGLDQIPLDTLLLGTRTEARLTAKQKEFARNLALGKSKAQAYREAYSDKGSKKTQANAGYRLSQSSDIDAIKSAYEVAIEAAKQRTPAQLRELVLHRLTKEALDEDSPPNARIQALKLLGTVSEVAAFTERKEVTNIRKSEDVRAALMEKLRTISGQAVEGVLITAEDSADSLLAEISTGTAQNEEENGQPEPEDDQPASDPTRPAPPPESFTTLPQDLHNVPHSEAPDNSIPHSQSPVFSNPPIEDAEIIGLDVDVRPHIIEATPLVAEKVPGGDPTPSDIETPPVDGTVDSVGAGVMEPMSP